MLEFTLVMSGDYEHPEKADILAILGKARNLTAEEMMEQFDRLRKQKVAEMLQSNTLGKVTLFTN